MTLPALLSAALVGGVAGVASGLIGIGGGVIMVPFLYVVLAEVGWSGVAVPSDLHAVVAHATSLAVIVPTAVVGAVTYARSERVAWRAALPMAPSAMAAAAAGAALAVELPPEVLKTGFGLLLLAAGVRLVVAPRSGGEGGPRALRLGLPVTVGSGVAVGAVSSLLGVGGGIVAIPLLIYLVGVDLPRVAATSIAVVASTAAAGAVAYAVLGGGVGGLPGGSLGYVYLPAAAALVPGAMLGARAGAGLNQKLDPTILRWLFAIFFIVVALRLIIRNAGGILGS